MKMLNKIKDLIRRLPNPFRWVAVAFVGMSLVVLGIIQLVTPGPGLLVLSLGLSILAIEFTWAELLLQRTIEKSGKMTAWLKNKIY